MNLDLSDEQRMLAEQVRGIVAERSPPDRLRALIDEAADWDEPLWRELGGMGFLAAAIPEAYGGLEMSELDLAVISEELGRANASLPFFSSVVLAAEAIRLAGTLEQKATWLPRMASGEVVGTFAYAEGAAWDEAAVRTCFVDGRLSGTKSPVADGGVAQVAVVLGRNEGGLVLALADLSAGGVERRRLQSFDELRGHFALTFDGMPAEPLEALAADVVVERLFDRGAVHAAFEAVGGAQACLEMARDYALERQIFGRPLAGFQAIKHRLADLLVKVELARSSALNAARVAVEDPDRLPRAAAAARLLAIDAFEMAARENIQIHGGIGYTFEANCHFYFRRERTLSLSLGGRGMWADRLIDTIGGVRDGERAA